MWFEIHSVADENSVYINPNTLWINILSYNYYQWEQLVCALTIATCAGLSIGDQSDRSKKRRKKISVGIANTPPRVGESRFVGSHEAEILKRWEAPCLVGLSGSRSVPSHRWEAPSSPHPLTPHPDANIP